MEIANDLKRLKIVIPGIPTPKQSMRHRIVQSKNGKQFVGSYQTEEVKTEAANMRSIVVNQLPKGFVPWTESVMVDMIDFIFPPLKSWSNRKKESLHLPTTRIWKTTKPDIDNLLKAIWDAMQGVVFINDSQIVALNFVTKQYGNKPRIEIMMHETGDSITKPIAIEKAAIEKAQTVMEGICMERI